VLDVGSGTGVLLPLLARAIGAKGAIVEMDASAAMLEKARARGVQGNTRFLQADAHAIPQPDASFDVVICNNAFPHFHDKPAALREMARVLRPGGQLVVCHTMSREAVNNLHRAIGGMVAADMLPEDVELRAWLEEAGFREVAIKDAPERYLVMAWRTR
jgi:ubiquinone/menaquinone biosynthesis C-methylase UbiE